MRILLLFASLAGLIFMFNFYQKWQNPIKSIKLSNGTELSHKLHPECNRIDSEKLKKAAEQFPEDVSAIAGLRSEELFITMRDGHLFIRRR